MARLPARFFENFRDVFDPLSELLGEALLASYLLAREQLFDVVASARFDEEDFFNFNLPPTEAIEYFRRKRIVKSKEFNDLRAEARAAAFTVGGVYRDDVLDGFKEEIARALEEGTAQQAVIKKFRDILEGAGHKKLGAFHLETVFRTNMQMAYGVGRRNALESAKDDLPLWEYHAVMDDRTRPHHAALDGMILPADHGFWDEHFPPWGFNCRCTVTARAELPDGYDHSNPSGEAQIAYDKAGNPAKAESGTTVYDLAVTKFKGVPPQSGLQSAIESAARRVEEGRKR